MFSCNWLLYLMLRYVTVSVFSKGLVSLTGSPWQPTDYLIVHIVNLLWVQSVTAGVDFIVMHGR